MPNKTEMLRRIGQHKPKLFGIMDLTQGYHQAPLEHNTKAFTAFITFSGVYEFTRLPFGPKRAPSYFQQIMATIGKLWRANYSRILSGMSNFEYSRIRY